MPNVPPHFAVLAEGREEGGEVGRLVSVLIMKGPIRSRTAFRV